MLQALCSPCQGKRLCEAEMAQTGLRGPLPLNSTIRLFRLRLQ